MSLTMPTNHFKSRSSNAAIMAGFSLVELLVSVTIGLILLLGLVTLLVNSSSTHTELQKSSAQIENGRYATQLLTDDLQLAGYYGEYKPTAYDLPEKTCTAAVTPVAPNMPSPVGYDLTSGVVDFACLSNRQAGTGVLVLRRTQTLPISPLPATNLDAGTVYLQVSQCNGLDTAPFKFGRVADVGVGGFNLKKLKCLPTDPALVRKVVTHIYYISSCNDCAAADGIPTLKEVELVDGAAQAAVALVEGIEDMQFDYGIDAGGDGSPDSYVASPAVATDWENVMAVRINLLARNVQPTAGYSDTKTYALGLAKPTYTVPAGAARTYKRHLYTSTVRVENPSARREVP